MLKSTITSSWQKLFFIIALLENKNTCWMTSWQFFWNSVALHCHSVSIVASISNHHIIVWSGQPPDLSSELRCAILSPTVEISHGDPLNTDPLSFKGLQWSCILTKDSGITSKARILQSKWPLRIPQIVHKVSTYLDNMNSAVHVSIRGQKILLIVHSWG